MGTQPGQPPGTAHPHRVPPSSPTGSLQPLTPPVAPAHGPWPAASQAATTQAHPEPRPHHGTPDWPAGDPTYTPNDKLPTRTHNAIPTDATAARPSDAGHPHTHGPTGGLTPQALATSGTEDLPATTHGALVPQRHHAPPNGPPARPAEPSSPGRPAPCPGPGPDPPRTAAPADAPQPADPGGPTRAATRGGRPCPGGTALADDGAEPPTPPTQPQRDAPAVGAEGLQRPPQRTPTPVPMGEPGGGTDQPLVRSADLTNETAHGGDEALADRQPDAEPEEPAPDTGCADSPNPPSAADHAGAAPRANLATRAGASTPGEALQPDPPETSAGSEARETTPDRPQRADEGVTSPSGHNHGDDSFDAFMDSCRDDPQAVPAPKTPRVHPVPQRHQADDTPLTVPRQAHLQRDYTTLGQIATTGEGQATASGAADWTTDERNAPGEGTRVEAATSTASEPVAPPPGAAPPWGRGHLDYARLEGDASHPSEQAEQEATQDLGFWIRRLVTGEQLQLAVRIRWVLSSRSRHLAEGTHTMADVTFGHRTGHMPPATMDHPHQWRYVATRLMAHMGAYSPDEMKGLHWRWHQRAALRIRTAMQDHNIWDIPGSPGYQRHASGHRRPRSQDMPEPPRQAARRNSPEHPRGPPPGRGSPSGTYSSPLRPFAPRRSPGSPQASRVQGDTPEQRQETRHPGRSRRRSRTPPTAARRVVFNEDMDRDHGGPRNPHRLRTSSTSDPRRRSKRPRTEQTHIPTILTPAERERQAALPADPRQTAGEMSSSSAAFLPGSATDSLPRGPHATGTRPRGPAPDPSPTQGAGGQPSPQSRSRQATEGTSRQPGHVASGPRADTEMTGTSSPQEPAGPLRTATPCSMPRQREPPTEYVPWGHPGATSRHPSLADAALDQDRVAMPPPPPRPPQQRGTGPFDEAELRALHDIHASMPSSELVATHREHLRNVDPNRLFAVVPLPHAPTTQIFVQQLQALVTRGTQVSDNLTEAWIWWFNTHQPAQGGVWVPHLGWVHTLIAPPTDPRPATTTGGREQAAPPRRPDNLRIPPQEGLEA